MAVGAFSAGLSGLNANATYLSVIGNNLANINTVGFKASAGNFTDLVSQSVQWSSPAVGLIGGQKQAIFPGGDGRLYAFAPESGALLWSFQGNPEGTVYKLGGLGTRNEIIGTPVIFEDRVYFSLGQDPEHGEGPSHMSAIDATRRGDLSKTGALWHNSEVDRALSTIAIHDGLLYHCDLSGIFRAIELASGKVVWQHDLEAAVWSSPYYVDGKVFLGDEDGSLVVFRAGREKHPRRRQNLRQVRVGKLFPRRSRPRRLHRCLCRRRRRSLLDKRLEEG